MTRGMVLLSNFPAGVCDIGFYFFDRKRLCSGMDLR